MKTPREIYEIPNPFWLSDIFIFMEHKELGTTIYVKVNCHNKIEEIGLDFEKRMHYIALEEIKANKYCVPATKLHKSILNRIGDEYWYSIKNKLDKK